MDSQIICVKVLVLRTFYLGLFDPVLELDEIVTEFDEIFGSLCVLLFHLIHSLPFWGSFDVWFYLPDRRLELTLQLENIIDYSFTQLSLLFLF